MEETNNLIELYHTGYIQLRKVINSYPPETLWAIPEGEKWNIHDAIVHIVDSDMVGWYRIRKIVAEDNPDLPAYEQSNWRDRLGYDSVDLLAIIDLGTLVREQNIRFLRTLPDETWQRTGIHAESGPLTLLRLFQMYAVHIDKHLKQIDRILSKM